MRVFRTLCLSFTILATSLLALAATDGAQKHDYQVRVHPIYHATTSLTRLPRAT